MSAIPNTRLGCEFDKFLHAVIGNDNGMPLTVLSALARLDVDPWEEAAKLTRLTEQCAIAQLASLLGALRHGPVLCPDPIGTAGPLIALLPHQEHASPVRRTLARVAPGKHPTAVSILLPVLTYLLFMLLSNWLLGNMQAPRQTDSPVASEAALPSPSGLVPRSGIAR